MTELEDYDDLTQFARELSIQTINFSVSLKSSHDEDFEFLKKIALDLLKESKKIENQE